MSAAAATGGTLQPRSLLSPATAFSANRYRFLRASQLNASTRVEPGPRLFAPVVSIVGSTVVSLTWTMLSEQGYPGTVWGQIARSVVHLGNGFGDTLIVADRSRSLWSWVTGDRVVAGGIGLVAGLVALGVATALLRRPQASPRPEAARV